jgi:hypothetical protein
MPIVPAKGASMALRLVALHRCLRRDEIRALHGVVDLHEQLAYHDIVVGLEIDRLDDPGGLRGDVDALRRPQRADRVNLGFPGDRLDLGGGNRDRRHLLAGEEIGDHLRAEQVEADEASADDHDEEEGDYKTLDHGTNRQIPGPKEPRAPAT